MKLPLLTMIHRIQIIIAAIVLMVVSMGCARYPTQTGEWIGTCHPYVMPDVKWTGTNNNTRQVFLGVVLHVEQGKPNKSYEGDEPFLVDHAGYGYSADNLDGRVVQVKGMIGSIRCWDETKKPCPVTNDGITSTGKRPLIIGGLQVDEIKIIRRNSPNAAAAVGSEQPKVSVSTQQGDNSFDFEFSTQGITGLGGLRVWQADTRELLWDIDLYYYKEPRLTYGDVPTNYQTFNGVRLDAHQHYPIYGERPRSLVAGKRYFVSIECLHGTLLKAEATPQFFFSFSTSPDGRVLAASPVEGMMTK